MTEYTEIEYIEYDTEYQVEDDEIVETDEIAAFDQVIDYEATIAAAAISGGANGVTVAEAPVTTTTAIDGGQQQQHPQQQRKHPEPKRKQLQELSQFPLSKIRTLMKLDPDVGVVTPEGLFLVAKATELLLDSLAKEAYAHTVKGKRKIMTVQDFYNVIETVDCLAFLDGALDF